MNCKIKYFVRFIWIIKRNGICYGPKALKSLRLYNNGLQSVVNNSPASMGFSPEKSTFVNNKILSFDF